MSSIVNSSIEELIQHLTNAVPGSENYKKFVNNVHSTFKYGKFGSAGQKDISRSYIGLVEKFRLHAQDDKANHLEKLFTSYINRPVREGSIPIHTRYDMLNLLLNLSESPLQTSFNLSLSKPKSKPQLLKVDDIFREEPLKGSHWEKKSNYADDDDDDDDWDFDVQAWIRERLGDRAINLQNSRRSSIQKNASNSEQQTEKDDMLEADINYDIIQEMESKQYWRSDFRNNPEMFETKFNFNDACTLAPALAKFHSQDERYLFYDPTRAKYITELDAIREVLFMLSGRPNYLFLQSENGKFQIKNNIMLMHLTESGFKAVLEFFCDYGNKLVKLRTIASKICRESCTLYGQTAQAFSSSILKMVWKFDKLLADFELEYQVDRVKSQVQDTYISLLYLRSELMERLYGFTIVYNFVEKSILNDIPELRYQGITCEQSKNTSAAPSKIAHDILSGLYNETSTHQTVGNNSIFLMLGKHLDNSFVPFVRMMDDWICTGTFHDPADEFFIIRTSNINQNSSQYWQEMYKIREVSSPVFLEPFVRRILFSGKARNLLMSLKLKEEEEFHRMTFQYNSEEFEYGIESLPLFDLLESKSEDLDYLNNPLDMYEGMVHMEKHDENKSDDKNENIIETEYAVVNYEQELMDDIEKDFKDDKENRETVKDATEQVKLPEIDSLADLNDIIETYPKTISALFPLWNKSKVQLEQYKGHIDDNQYVNIDPMVNFQPFTERFREKFENYLHPRYMRIGQQLYDALVEQCHLWRHLRALAGVYFMQQGETMHQLSDVIFDRIDKKQMWYDSYVLNEIVLNTVETFKWLDKNSVSVWVDDEAGKKPNTKTVRIFEKIVLEYRLPWPLDNIIRGNTLKLYKRIFIFLLQVKRSKYLLERLSFSRNQDNSTAMILFYVVRMKLIWFLNTIWDYTMRTILLSETENFYKKLKQVFDIDEMISLHGHYIHTVHDRCLLNENATPMHKSILDVLDLTIQFSTLYTRYRGENVSFYDHSRYDRSRRFKDDSSDSESDSFLIDDDDDDQIDREENIFDSIVPVQVDYDDFLNGLGRIDREFNRHKEFISNSIQAIARVGGFWWFDALALALG
ncbi:Spc98 family-domain-containing protein [Glomus cerebriforme]|uniref:Spindle pole body component n=1 Tax=Glomus cerebriforme TaxID=658196 RepID=A0A397T548_9GLOM|nr:Spc98 family-domain-containing protein [Glomus cerebriforme]